MKPVLVLALAASFAACKKEDKGPPTITLEQLQRAQAGAGGAPIPPTPPGSPPVASRENANIARGEGLPTEMAARTLSVESLLALVPADDSDQLNPSRAYNKGDKIRFIARITGFALASGDSDFELEWWIADAAGNRIVEQRKAVRTQFTADQGYSIVLAHKPAALAAGKYTAHVRVVDNKAAYLVREAETAFSYGEGTEAAAQAGAVEIRDLVMAGGDGPIAAGSPVTFSLVLVGLLVDATQSVRTTIDVSLVPSGGGAPRVLPQQHNDGKADAQGRFPITVTLAAPPAGSYQLNVKATDVATGRAAESSRAITIQ